MDVSRPYVQLKFWNSCPSLAMNCVFFVMKHDNGGRGSEKVKICVTSVMNGLFLSPVPQYRTLKSQWHWALSIQWGYEIWPFENRRFEIQTFLTSQLLRVQRILHAHPVLRAQPVLHLQRFYACNPFYARNPFYVRNLFCRRKPKWLWRLCVRFKKPRTILHPPINFPPKTKNLCLQSAFYQFCMGLLGLRES